MAQVLRYPMHFGHVLSSGSPPWLFLLRLIFRYMSLILFLKLRTGLSSMQFLRSQQAAVSFDPAISSFSSSQCASVYVPWAVVSARGYLHPLTCKKGVLDQPRCLLLI